MLLDNSFTFVCEFLVVTIILKNIFEEEVTKIITKACFRSKLFFITSPEPFMTKHQESLCLHFQMHKQA